MEILMPFYSITRWLFHCGLGRRTKYISMDDNAPNNPPPQNRIPPEMSPGAQPEWWDSELP